MDALIMLTITPELPPGRDHSHFHLGEFCTSTRSCQFLRLLEHEALDKKHLQINTFLISPQKRYVVCTDQKCSDEAFSQYLQHMYLKKY